MVTIPPSRTFRPEIIATAMRIFVIAGVIGIALSGAALADDRSGSEFFEAKVRPVLAENCYTCHGPEKQKGGLRLDSISAIKKGGESGPAVSSGNPAASLLIKAIRQSDADLKMPPTGKLTDEQIADLTAWVKMGAPWPESTSAPASASIEKSHWAFQPVRAPEVPQIRNPQFAIRNSVDAFVAARLQSANLMPSAAADRITLIRRATFDLTGLPPTPDEIDAFVSDPSSDAFARLVDRLLASPRYGERWARHWLDVARYADSKGYVFEEERRYPFAYTYRDYVIRAFNDDLPFDRFILEQIAADKLDIGDDKRPLAAMGYLTLGRRFLNNSHDIIDDRIDVVSRGFLGLSVTCARCHDHKYDPIPIDDYYSLYGVFASSVEPKDLPLIETPERTPALDEYNREVAKRETDVANYRAKRKDALVSASRVLAALPGLDAVPLRAAVALGPNPAERLSTKKLDAMLSTRDQQKVRELIRKVDEFKATSPNAPRRAMVLTDAPSPMNPHILVRGNPANLGRAVPRQFLAVLSGTDRKPFKDGSGRLELARAIADPANPLTARVFVNRVWAHHFGVGLVATPSDFGVRSDPPSNPELLDYLADRFVRDGWSVKKLHRLIMLSSTYQQKSDERSDCTKVDPENRLLWKFNRQRLELEALRDSVLAVSGKLDPTIGGPAVDLLKEPFISRRTIYGFIDRQNLPGMYRTFDFASPDTHAPRRYSTTVPQQALFLMNGRFVMEQVRSLAARPDLSSVSSPEEKITRLYRLLYGRRPLPNEIDLGLQFLHEVRPGPESKLTPWEQYAQVLLLANEFAFVD